MIRNYQITLPRSRADTLFLSTIDEQEELKDSAMKGKVLATTLGSDSKFLKTLMNPPNKPFSPSPKPTSMLAASLKPRREEEEYHLLETAGKDIPMSSFQP